jgi:beta-galactosidase
MDCCGFPKDKYYYFESCWSDEPMVHVMPATWNWTGKDGQSIRVLAFSNAKQVELFLNGKSLGTKDVPHDDYVEWKVPYQPGQLLAKAYTAGQTVATDTVDTTGAPSRIELSPDRTTLLTNAEDAIVVPVSVLDAQGRIVPDSGNRVTFQLNGPGEILGVSNGDPVDHDTDKSNQRNAFHGHCIVVIEAGKESGTIQLTASSPGLASRSVNFEVK